MQDTIVAPATPRGVSAIAAIRVSGIAVKQVLGALFRESIPEDRKACYATARNPETQEVIDSLVYIYFKGPHSYTGEDSLELFPHGNPLIVRELIKAICQVQGVRLALPGEYTRRAFLNGTLDLVRQRRWVM
jgi:tRNA modification GTPase